MLIIGTSEGNFESLKLMKSNEDIFFDKKNIINMKDSEIKKIICKKDKIFFGTTNGHIGFFEKKSNKIVQNKNNFDAELGTYRIFENGNILAFYNNHIRIWEKYKNSYFFSRRKLICGKKFVFAHFSKSERFLLSTSFFDNQLYLWSFLGEKIILGGKNELTEFIVSLEGSREDIFSIGTHSGSIYIYSIYGDLIRSIKKNPLTDRNVKPCLQKSVAWFNNNIFFSGKSNGKIEIIDLRCNKNFFNLKGHSCEVSNLSSSSIEENPTSFLMASLDVLGNLKLWDLRSEKELFYRKRFGSKITSLSFS